MALRVGIDFGTTNSSIARTDASGNVQLTQYAIPGGLTDSYRSLLYLERLAAAGNRKVASIATWSGPEGIERYLAADVKGRLIQSLKSFLSSRTLESTDVFGKRYTIEDLISRILRDLRETASKQFGVEIKSAVVGRPVRFVGADQPADDTYAQGRLEQAFKLAGFETVEFEMEPVAAAHYYESTLDHDELILIGDFGGGTSDFSLIHVGPGVRKRGRKPSDILGNSGLGLAGDAFDAKIVRHLVAPALGAGSQIRSSGKLLPVPSWPYAKLERWHHLSFLNHRDTMNLLRTVERQAVEPEKIAGFTHLITEDLGYQLHRSVQKLKADLSSKPAAKFVFSDPIIDLRATVQRSTFEDWIAEELQLIADCVDGLLTSTKIGAKQVDRVFLTGGSSFVPSVRKIFETRFGGEKIQTGNEFTSVARGLALRAAELQ
ncbi:MAG: Hsp70 family protein [Acidobacteriota bacterium]